MNILFFLKPKSELAYIKDYHTLRQALEIMVPEEHLNELREHPLELKPEEIELVEEN